MYVTGRLLQMYDFIDRSRVAIWGWSYGGFVTLSALANDRRNIFKYVWIRLALCPSLNSSTMYLGAEWPSPP